VWIESGFVDLLPGDPFMPKSLTGNIVVSGERDFDVVSLTLNERLPYATTQELDPTRIIVDVYGATSNTNWITQVPNTREIKNVYYQQVATDVFRITIELQHKQIWGYELGYEGTNLKIRIRPQPSRLRLKSLAVAVDAGHGGDNFGALGATGAKEKDVTFSIAHHLKKRLEDEGARVILLRNADTNLTITERFQRAYREKADLLVSIHANSVGLTSDPFATRGTATFYKHLCYRPLSQFILDAMVRTGLPAFGNVGSFNFALLGPTELPSVLVETAFISHPEEEMKLLDDDFRREIAERIVDGIEDFLDWCDE
jgi:N-acetylmuramoyl-L-alanine amidase